MNNFRNIINLFLFVISVNMPLNLFSQTIPYVYNVENTGASYNKPVLPPINELPIIQPLTDPFMWSATIPDKWSNADTRSTNFTDWSRRRAEIAWEIQHYEIGEKPVRPDSISASYSGGILTVNVTENGKTIVLTSQIILPAGTGPFPAVIGMNRGSGSLPSSIFSNRNIAQITYNHNQVVTYNSKNQSDPYYKLYPNLFYTGQYSSWSWGVSRIIDGLELVQANLPIDLKKLAVTGCSYAGKMALFAGALDERIALTIAQESGGGGAAAWRVSQSLPVSVETLGATSRQWFMESMFAYSGNNVSKLPFDHHELCAMIAPRALLILGNPDFVWLADESGYVSSRAAHEVWKTFGIADRFGFSIVGGHGHCVLPNSQYPEVEAFVDKFLLGITTANTNITKSPYETVDYLRWIKWWGTNKPVFPASELGKTESLWFEAERFITQTAGTNFNVISDPEASNGKYITVKPGIQAISAAPADSSGLIKIHFTVSKDSTYNVFARMKNPTADDDSFWVKFDNGPFILCNGLGTNGWQWLKLASAVLTKGKHSITIGYREDGATLDKICISNYQFAPSGKGEADLLVSNFKRVKNFDGYSLNQNYPNPFSKNTSISFEIPKDTFVSLKIHNLSGNQIAELAGSKYPQGKHTLEFNSEYLSKGVYFYSLQTDDYTISRKMILKKN